MPNYLGLNVGCGPHYADGWLNTDVSTQHKADRLIDVFDMPSEYADTFDRAYVGHVLEHIEWSLVPKAIAAIAACVKQGGVVMIVGPCIIKAIETQQPTWLIEQILCNPMHIGSPADHKWTPTQGLTMAAAVAGGLHGVRAIPIGTVTDPWPNPCRDAWQTAVCGEVQIQLSEVNK